MSQDPFAAPSGDPQQSFGAPQPQYGGQQYGQPQPGYGQPAPGYGQLAPGYGQPTYGDGYGGYPTQNRGTNGFAIAALIFGIFPFLAGLLGIIFGFIARNQIKRTGQNGGGMALAGIILGFIWLALVIVIIIVAVAYGSSHSCTTFNGVTSCSST